MSCIFTFACIVVKTISGRNWFLKNVFADGMEFLASGVEEREEVYVQFYSRPFDGDA